VWKVGHESWWLGHVDVLLEISIQEGVIDVDLVDRPAKGNGMR